MLGIRRIEIITPENNGVERYRLEMKKKDKEIFSRVLNLLLFLSSVAAGWLASFLGS